MTMTTALDATIDRAIEKRRIVGAVTIVRQHGELLYESARGLMEREAGRPMQVDAIFRYSSLTKPIVATAILAMVDEGRIGLDDPVTDYLPYFTPRLEDGSVPIITIRQLLTHSAGVGGRAPLTDEEKLDPRFQAVGFNLRHLSLDENMERLARVPLLCAPGTGWNYAQSLDVLGAVAGKIVGGTLGDAVGKYVTGPLRMDDTRFGVVDPGRLAVAYADGKDGAELMADPHDVPNRWGGTTTFSPSRIFDNRVFHSGGGGMAGTARDLMMLLETLRTGGGDILKSETVAAGMSNQVPQLVFAVAPGWHFGFFGALLTNPERARTPQSLGTTRWGGIYGHTWFLDPVTGLSVVAMTNTGIEGSDGAYPKQVRDAIYASL